MKKTLITSFITAAIFAVVLPASGLTSQAFANNSQKNTVVRGNVYGDNYAGVGGLTVKVTCNNAVQYPATDGYGLYSATFTNTQCKPHHFATASVTYKGQTQQQQVEVSQQGTATMDFYYGTVTVPEFGVVTGAMALLTSGSSLFAFRRMRKA